MSAMSLMQRRLLILTLGCFVSLPATTAFAQPVTCTINSSGNGQDCTTGAVSVAFTIARTVRLTVVQGAAFNLLPTSGLQSTTDYDNGFFDAAGLVQLQVSANTSWAVKIAATAANFAAGCPTRSASSLTWGTTSAVRNTVLSTTAANVFTGASATALQSQDVYFRAALAWATDPPVTTSANCKLPVSFSATSP